jgi:hypothetical protein
MDEEIDTLVLGGNGIRGLQCFSAGARRSGGWKLVDFSWKAEQQPVPIYSGAEAVRAWSSQLRWMLTQVQCGHGLAQVGSRFPTGLGSSRLRLVDGFSER